TFTRLPLLEKQQTCTTAVPECQAMRQTAPAALPDGREPWTTAANRCIDNDTIMSISPDGTGLAILGLGFALGVRHALDPDHLVAVSTIVSRNKSIARSSLAGAFWGLGHTASLFICGTIVLALRLSIPESFVATAEKAVAGML